MRPLQAGRALYKIFGGVYENSNEISKDNVHYNGSCGRIIGGL